MSNKLQRAYSTKLVFKTTSHFQHWHLCCRYLGPFSDTEYYFQQLAYRDSKVHKCFMGLIQMQFSFDCNQGKQNDPTACWHPRGRWLAETFSCCETQYGGCTWWNPQLALAERSTAPFEPQGHYTLKFLHYSIFRAKGGHFRGLIPDTNYKHLERFVMLGTHSELHRGRMSHICDISPLKVN